MDEQITGFLGKEGIFCLPLFLAGEPLGVIVIGLDRVGFSHLSQQSDILRLFSNQAAVALHVDHLKQTRLNTIQSERLNASFALSRKVVHEVNTPLSIIKNYLTVLRKKMPENHDVHEEFTVISEEVDRVAQILRELSDFSKSRIPTIGSLDLNAFLSDLTKVLRTSRIFDSRITLHLHPDTSLPPMDTDKNKMKQIVINLIRNAAEAMENGGNLFITTQHAANPLPPLTKQDGEKDSGFVEITIRDDGPGIPEAIQTRIFEPYVTTKGTKHSGLGLSIVFQLIKELKGTITCKSDGKNGTCFQMVFPYQSKSRVMVIRSKICLIIRRFSSSMTIPLCAEA